MKCTALLLISILIVSACSNRQSSRWLQEASSCLDRSSDSTLLILKNIENPASLHDTSLARYNYLYVTANLRTGRKNQSDSLLLRAAETFVQAKDSEMVARCFMQAGFLNMHQKVHNQADSLFIEGVRYTSDPKTRITLYEYAGYNKLEQNQPQEAFLYHAENRRDTALVPAEWKITILSDLAQAFRYIGQTDSALAYYQAAIRMAGSIQNNYQIAFFYNKISDIHKDKGDMEKALIHLKLSIGYEKRRQSIPRHLLATGRLFLFAGETDSARIYLQKAIQSPNSYVATAAYLHLANLYELEGNNKLAVSNWQNYSKSYNDLVSETYLDQVQKEFQDQKIRIENNELKLKRKQQDIYLLSLSLLLTIIAATGYILYIRERRKKVLQEQLQKEEELKGQVTRLEQERELIVLRERATALREQLFRRLSASQKIPSLAGKQKREAGSDEKSRLTAEEIEELVQTVNDIWPGFAERLKTVYPLLRPKDIGFCCLLKSGISTKDLASIYYITPSAISQKKARMRREKFAIEEEDVSLDSILRDF